MINIQITDNDIFPISQLQSCSNDIAQYVNENIYACGGKTVSSVLQIYDDYRLTYG